MRASTPTYLYHGSAVVTTSLNADFAPVCAYESKAVASEKGFIEALNRKYPQKGFDISADEIIIVLDIKSPPITMAALRNVIYYVYTIRYKYDDKWQQIPSDDADAPKLWGTPKTIHSIMRAELMKASDYLKGKKYTISHPRYPTIRHGYADANISTTG